MLIVVQLNKKCNLDSIIVRQNQSQQHARVCHIHTTVVFRYQSTFRRRHCRDIQTSLSLKLNGLLLIVFLKQVIVNAKTRILKGYYKKVSFFFITSRYSTYLVQSKYQKMLLCRNCRYQKMGSLKMFWLSFKNTYLKNVPCSVFP